MPPKNKAKKKVPKQVANTVNARAAGYCEIMHWESGCNGQAEQMHHRKLRSQGGEHTASNLIFICHRCHHWVHMHPAIAYERGWLVKGSRRPVAVPLERRGVMTLLDDAGGLEGANMEPLSV